MSIDYFVLFVVVFLFLLSVLTVALSITRPPVKGVTSGKITKAEIEITAGWFNAATSFEIITNNGQTLYGYLDGNYDELKNKSIKFSLGWLFKTKSVNEDVVDKEGFKTKVPRTITYHKLKIISVLGEDAFAL